MTTVRKAAHPLTNHIRGLVAALLMAATFAPAAAASLRLCDQANDWSAPQQDRLFRLAAVIKTELEKSGQRIALISRSGLNLQRFGLRYSHAGLTLQANPQSPWAIRQLYFACEEGRPRLFDQGLSAFLLGTSDPSIGYISVVFLPETAADKLESAALDKHRALQLLGADYSANAYPYSLRYQNCNQWIAELMAAAWGPPTEATPGADANGVAPVLRQRAQAPEQAREQAREQAQRWLQASGYEPSTVNVGSRWLMALGTFVPWLRSDDHPADDIHQQRYRTTLPAALESFVQAQAPSATRIEFCHNTQHIVVRRGWQPIAEGCVPEGADTVLPLH